MVRISKEMKRLQLDVPLLIGGATTSKVHTAVKLSPEYPNVLYVQDASRAVGVVSSLLGEHRGNTLESAQVQYADIREQRANRTKRALASIEEARSNGLSIDFSEEPPVRPKQTGVWTLTVDVETLARILTGHHFSNRELAGRFPNILTDNVVGIEATKLFNDAQQMLQTIVAEQWVSPKARFTIVPANRDGDDVVCFNDESRIDEAVRFQMLRQQNQKRHTRNLSLADFIAPTGTDDWLGAFCVTVGSVVKEQSKWWLI